MDRKRVPGPELTVPPLVEYALDQKRWSPQEECRHDANRQPEDLRPIYLKTGLISQASGSAYIELEKTKIACGVYGPRPIKKSGYGFSGTGTLNCEFKFATFACVKRRNHIRDPQERELSMILTQALTPAVRLELLPKSAIDVYITVLECDGLSSCFAAAITAASVALAHAGIEMIDLVAACSASYVIMDRTLSSAVPPPSTTSDSAPAAVSLRPPTIIMDADLEEEKFEEGSIMVAYMPSLNEVTHVLQNGKVDRSIVSQSVEHCIEACNKIYAVMRHALVESIDEKQTR
ncbi:hypothetical protein BGW38_004745 [Lunasporangiospora selenospora]|uniref:Exoribonuclease phosphorolytic domain-containing protein n=1 Tax=Lunasporangiospora selenospora TaxID=979761 RepID=A0A9P6FZW2_9FUNG|nr:hypothetical protein BGW38_004745 [Lunasporangiospora selenospora]